MLDSAMKYTYDPFNNNNNKKKKKKTPGHQSLLNAVWQLPNAETIFKQKAVQNLKADVE